MFGPVRFGGLALVLLGLVGASLATTEEHDFEFHLNGSKDYTTVEVPGRKTTVGRLHGTLILMPSGAPPLAWGEIVYGTCAVSIAAAEGSAPDIRGDCDFHDRERHHLYAVAERVRGDAEVGGGGQGVWKFIGGTGKFANVAGECSYSIEYFEDDELTASGLCRIAGKTP